MREAVAGGAVLVHAAPPAFLSGRDRDEMLTARRRDRDEMLAARERDQDEMLTAREREILLLLADGMSNSAVARKLFISQETVKSHVRHILDKLDAGTRAHAVAIALREAIID